MSDEASTIERIVPESVSPGDATGQATLEFHLQRYRFAATHLRPGRLLDIACGVGYGTRLLAVEGDGVTEAVGVDVAEDAIDHASRHYALPTVRFLQHDAMTFHDESGFHSIVSLETFEHIRDPDALLARLGGLLLPGGVIIASVPTTPSVDVNPYHLGDFTERSFSRDVPPAGPERGGKLPASPELSTLQDTPSGGSPHGGPPSQHDIVLRQAPGGALETTPRHTTIWFQEPISHRRLREGNLTSARPQTSGRVPSRRNPAGHASSMQGMPV